MSIISMAEAIRAWLAGDGGKDWHTCADCQGDGYIIAVQWQDGGYDDFPASHGYVSDDDPENPRPIRRQWRSRCQSCHGVGTYHYEAGGRRIPGKGDEFDRPATQGRVNYAEYIRGPEWRNKALILKARAGWQCQECGRASSEMTLDVHHLTYERLGHERADDLIVLCRSCHERHERNKKRRNAAQVQL